MKTTDELIEYRLPKSAPGWGRITYEELDAIVKRAQEDAFGSGWRQGMRDAKDMMSKGLNIEIPVAAFDTTCPDKPT